MSKIEETSGVPFNRREPKMVGGTGTEWLARRSVPVKSTTTAYSFDSTTNSPPLPPSSPSTPTVPPTTATSTVSALSLSRSPFPTTVDITATTDLTIETVKEEEETLCFEESSTRCNHFLMALECSHCLNRHRGPTHGHYITIVKSGSRWIVFDDNNVYPIEQSEISRYFGDTPGQGSAYCLFYQAVDIDSPFSGLPPQATKGLRPRATTTSSASTGGITTGTSNASKHPAEDLPPIPPLPPAAVEANLATSPPPAEPPLTSPTIPAALVDPTAALDSPKPHHSKLPPLNVDSPSPVANGIALPPSASAPVSAVEGPEKNGWSLRGRFSRTKSQAAPSRSASGSGPSESIPHAPVANDPISTDFIFRL